MSFTVVVDKATGDLFTETMWDVYIKDNLNYIMGLLNGTGADGVTHPAALTLNNDAVWSLSKNGSNPIITVDTADTLQYIRASNEWWFAVASVVNLKILSNGKLGGTPFYTSSETSIVTTGAAFLTHGLGATPRFVDGLYGTVSGTRTKPLDRAAAARSTVRISDVSSTTITINNDTGATAYVEIHAML